MKTLKIMFFLSLIYSCNNQNSILEDILNDTKGIFTESELKEFYNKPEDEALNEIHFGKGIYFRNTFIRNPKDSLLINYFHSLNIYNEDYMSSIVFTSLHRKLNNKPIQLDKQLVETYKITDFYNKLETDNTNRGLKYYNSYSIKDTITLIFPINEYGSVQYYSFPMKDYKKNILNDKLKLKCEVIEKNKINDSLNISFKVKILSRKVESNITIKNEFLIDDVFDLDLRLAIIE